MQVPSQIPTQLFGSQNQYAFLLRRESSTGYDSTKATRAKVVPISSTVEGSRFK